MASALMMAWVCVALTLAQLNTAGGHRVPHGRLTDQDEQEDGLKLQPEAAPENSAGRSFSAPVWNFMQGKRVKKLRWRIKAVKKSINKSKFASLIPLITNQDLA